MPKGTIAFNLVGLGEQQGGRNSIEEHLSVSEASGQ
jgi:hypothetical protein